MSQSYQYILPVLDAVESHATVALLQTPIVGNNLVLNGLYVNGVSGVANFGFTAHVAIRCNGDFTTVIFTVIGSQNGVPISHRIAGTNNTTVVSLLYFDTIISISVAGLVPAGGTVTAGTGGTSGFLPLILLNTEKGLSDVGYALQFIGAANSTATVYQSLGNIANSGQTYDQLIESQELLPIAELADGTVTIPTIVQMKSVCKSIVVKITDNQSEKTTMLFLQL